MVSPCFSKKLPFSAPLLLGLLGSSGSCSSLAAIPPSFTKKYGINGLKNTWFQGVFTGHHHISWEKNTCVTCVPCSLQVVHVFFTQIHRQSSIGPPSQLESLLNCLHLGIKSWVSSFSDTLTHPNILSLINLFVYYSHTHPTIRSSSLCQQISSKKSISTINMIGLP